MKNLKKMMIFGLMFMLIGITTSCRNPFGPDELKPGPDGIYVFHPDDMPQVQFKYDMTRWEMTINNRASLGIHVTIKRHVESSAGVSYHLGGFASTSYVEYYEKGKAIHIIISRDGKTTTFSAILG